MDIIERFALANDRERGYVLYEGASLIDGAPIAVIATMASNNEKTGLPGKKNMVQTWIIRTDIAPHKALKTGDDYSICGDCVHRPTNGGSCYVTVFQAPLAVFNAYHRGSYSRDVKAFYRAIQNRLVRFGAYGDSAAAPTSLWASIAAQCQGYTGYTHQWARADFDNDLLQYVMASADTEEQAQKLKAMNKRYFRVIKSGAPILDREIECLSDSVGKKCADCLLCDGGDKGKNVYITVHGSKAAKFNPDVIAAA